MKKYSAVLGGTGLLLAAVLTLTGCNDPLSPATPDDDTGNQQNEQEQVPGDTDPGDQDDEDSQNDDPQEDDGDE